MAGVKRLLRKIPGVQNASRIIRQSKRSLLRRFLLKYTPPQGSILKTVEKFSTEHPSLIFCQIGAHSGEDQFEELRRKDGWRGVMVEPQKSIFAQLISRNQRATGIAFENAAITRRRGTKQLFKIGFTSAPWATNLASFDEKVIKKHVRNGWIAKCCQEDGTSLPENTDRFFTTEDVRCITLRDLIETHGIMTLDLLVIDTEGHDFEVIRQIDSLGFKPSMIVFENKHLTTASLIRCIQFLRKRGYNLISEGPDTLASKSFS